MSLDRRQFLDLSGATLGTATLAVLTLPLLSKKLDLFSQLYIGFSSLVTPSIA